MPPTAGPLSAEEGRLSPGSLVTPVLLSTDGAFEPVPGVPLGYVSTDTLLNRLSPTLMR
jgi:hypothetical protein